MLYMVYHKHTAEMCPGGLVRPDKEFLIKLEDQMKNAGVNLIEGYIDAPGHEFHLVIEADDIAKLNSATEQLRLVGDINKIVPNIDQPRKDMGDAKKIEELAQSIQQEGLIQPIIARSKGNKFEIVVGERRWRACKIAGIDKIPVIVRDVNDHHFK